MQKEKAKTPEEKKQPEKNDSANDVATKKTEADSAVDAAEKKESEEKKPPEPCEDEAGKLKKELADQQDRYLRVLAEYDNFRKRTQSEKAAVYNNAVADTVINLLPVADNIERALAQENMSFEDMKKGVEMISAQFKAFFESLSITEIGKAGDDFDPALHNAVAHVEDESLGENVVAEVFQKGYKLGDKVVRHAMVKVAN